MPTRRLPSSLDLEQLTQRAKDLLRDQRAGTQQAAQRIREFHPHFSAASDSGIAEARLTLSDAQLAVAREYGFASWDRLEAYVENPVPDDFSLPAHERVQDAAFRRAVDLLDSGDAIGLREHLRTHPRIVSQRVAPDGGNYFQKPTLLEFVAENPTRCGNLPPNAADIARTILEAGAKSDRAALNSALDLVASSDVARLSGVQRALIDVLCEYGADPNAAVYTPALYGEFDAVEALIQRGARVDLVVASACGLVAEAKATLPSADAESRQKALAMAAQHGHTEIVRLLLDAGEDPNRFAPIGGHSHATPLHQAALGGHLAAVRLLVERGARTDVHDILFDGTPLDWANYSKQTAVAEYLRERP
jgi:hypothetical protein